MDTPSRTLNQLGTELRRFRKKRDLTQLQLSTQINKRQATVSSLEASGSGTLDTLYAILSALDLELVIRPRSKNESRKLGDIF